VRNAEKREERKEKGEERPFLFPLFSLLLERRPG
jgi:hypothetical protein